MSLASPENEQFSNIGRFIQRLHFSQSNDCKQEILKAESKRSAREIRIKLLASQMVKPPSTLLIIIFLYATKKAAAAAVVRVVTQP
ncbi:CLUMA_CG019229, isoform A [Clunio marinus]|uniref:CLUMA_CG019229, isoform A n=1 Tax=Clunio marinus TaxID=568069 RepID=A0A1J1J2X5_9DIPT|nr:CLUMA_CG019229, isoform A [Clunio marinus]